MTDALDEFEQSLAQENVKMFKKSRNDLSFTNENAQTTWWILKRNVKTKKDANDCGCVCHATIISDQASAK